ncbi:response regulator transcription factor [uncultured Clostridium sp.]|jgi:DNA-binding response OmpR family regulator|uniref:response regulator transcription factor n=1 Tax=uncultured Clostridium sp. TaxID=59620 RepID=UPI00262C9F9D|nr:response regulator transcription factor [uncultured Clostridium sp.]
MNTILIVEDDMDIHNLEKEILGAAGYKVLSAYSGTEAVMMVKYEKCSLVLLDLMLPAMSGNEVIKKIKEINDIPVIAVTSKDDKESKVDLFRSGADDYITKPFDIDVFLLRIEAVLRRYNILSDISEDEKRRNLLEYKDVTLNLDTYEVIVLGNRINLTRLEFEILKLLMSRPTNVFTKNQIYESVWNDECGIEDNSVSVHISNIRAKLTKISKEESYIETVWGIGFKLN